jgi:ketosteroid isomerase-like protein
VRARRARSIGAALLGCVLVLAAAGSVAATDAAAADEAAVAALDAEYQAAVARNDAATMDRILADDMVLVTGRGAIYTKQDFLNEARGGGYVYERQEDSNRKVRVRGDTAVVTALLWARGTHEGKPFEYRVWFSDTYVRTSSGWRYWFGQSSLPLPPQAVPQADNK